MSNDAIFIAVSAAIAAVGTFLSVDKLANPSPPSLRLAQLSYADGEVRQHIEVVGGPVQARWAASVRRGERLLCAGDGASTYIGSPAAMTIDQWTGDDCPALQPGDVLVASWTYALPDGGYATINTTVTVP